MTERASTQKAISSMKTINGSIPQIVNNSDGLYEGDLRHYFKVVFEKAQNLSNPYHNFRHIFHVVYLCYKAIHYYEGKIGKRDARALLIAAMFHDFNHRGKTGNDDLNIILALRGLWDNILEEDKPLFPLMVKLIQATEYPHKTPGEELSLLAQILRDADISQAFSLAWIQQIVFGLAGEMGMPTKAILEMQGKFLASIKFQTTWAKEEYPKEVILAKVTEANELLACLA
jgi:HD superfamily phosphodiesterase